MVKHRKSTLAEIAAAARERPKGKETTGSLWVLFTGPAGSGKGMTAEMLAKDLGVKLFRVDLDKLISKYIGETEKNLRQLFKTAHGSQMILYFDESDSLFGKRSEVKDAHDRYANIGIDYVLRLLENYHGIAVLTTKKKENLDPAFVRRCRFLIDFC